MPVTCYRVDYIKEKTLGFRSRVNCRNVKFNNSNVNIRDYKLNRTYGDDGDRTTRRSINKIRNATTFAKQKKTGLKKDNNIRIIKNRDEKRLYCVYKRGIETRYTVYGHFRL